MFSFKSIVLIAAAFAINVECSGVPAVAAPLVAPAHVGYAHAVPQNIPPYASQVNVYNRAVAPLIAAAPVAAPQAAPLAPAPYLAGPAPAPYLAGPVPAPYLAGGAPAPYLAGPVPALASPYALSGAYGPAPYAAPYPYSAPLLRSPFGVAPAFVR